MMRMLTTLQEAIDVFNRDYPRPGMEPLVLSEMYDLQVDWPKPYHNSDHPGVYCLFDDQMTLVYVGKASFSHVIGGRLGARICYGPDRRALLTDPKWHAANVRYIATIRFPLDHAFEASALEEFLITRLSPCPKLNTIGSGGL